MLGILCGRNIECAGRCVTFDKFTSNHRLFAIIHTDVYLLKKGLALYNPYCEARAIFFFISSKIS
jgi:hypothetical protein